MDLDMEAIERGERQPLLGPGASRTVSFTEPDRVNSPVSGPAMMGAMSPLTPGTLSAGSPERRRKLFHRSNSRATSDISVLKKLLNSEYVEEHFPDLDASSVAEASEALDAVVSVSTANGAVRSRGLKDISLKVVFKKAMQYKRRATDGNLLHFAIWFVAVFGVDVDVISNVLDSLADPDEVLLPASYAGGPKTIFVTALHIAAGLGQLEVLKILANFVSSATTNANGIETRELYVSQWAKITGPLTKDGTSHTKESKVGDVTSTGIRLTGADYLEPNMDEQFTPFFQAIHESTYGGHGDVTMYLLKCKAECTQNMQKITPLHFIALMGIQGCLEQNLGDNLRTIINAFTQSGRKVEHVTATADMSNFHLGTSLTPLEVAVCDASRFPQDFLGLLAPCLAEGSNLTYFDDIKRIADITPDGALNLVRTIANKGKKHQHVLRRFRVNAQEPGMSDMLASIFYTAPLAASEMLDLLEADPDVEDSAHHSIPARTQMWGLLKSVPMRCTYQNEYIKRDNLVMPFWAWKTKNKKREALTWHDDFVPRPVSGPRTSDTKNVKVVTCLLPNILDIDIFMAFSHCQKEFLDIMNKKTVQGTIFCLWTNLVEFTWVVDVFYRFIDVFAYVALGIYIPAPEGHKSLAWTLVAGGALYQLLMMGSALQTICSKWSKSDDATQATMWSPYGYWSLGYIVPVGAQALVALAFAVDLSFHGDGERSRFDDRLLAVCLMLSCLRCIWTWRLSVVGSTIYTISTTFVAGAVSQMLFILCMLLVSSMLSLMVLSRLHTVGLAVSAYRGFLFGDDHGFTDLGMDVGHSKAFAGGDGVLLFSSLFGAFFFNVIVLNIVIAIYGHEYEKNQYHTPAQFMLGRADYCVKSVISCYCVQWKGANFNKALKLSATLLIACGIGLGAWKAKSDFGHMWISAFLYGIGAFLLRVSLIQCEWFSPEGEDSENQQRFLWICHSRDWVGSSKASEEAMEDRLLDISVQASENQSAVHSQLKDLDEKMIDIFEHLQMRNTPKTSKSK